MSTSLIILLYLFGAVNATFLGVLYYMSMENMKDANHKMLIVNLLSVFFTPFGAYVVTLFLHMRRMSAMAALTPKSE